MGWIQYVWLILLTITNTFFIIHIYKKVLLIKKSHEEQILKTNEIYTMLDTKYNEIYLQIKNRCEVLHQEFYALLKEINKYKK